MPQLAKTTTSADGTTIGYRDVGVWSGGTTIVLIEGALATQDNGDGKALTDALVRDHRVITYDRRGRGESRAAAAFSVEAELADLAAVIAATGEPDLVCGFSSGAVIALYDAAITGRQTRYVLFEPPLVGSDPDGVPSPEVMARLCELLDEGRNSAAVQHWMSRIVGIPGPVVWVLRRTLPRAKSPDGPDNARSLLGDAAVVDRTRFAVPEEAGDITQPTAVVSGTKSVKKLREAAETVAAAIPGAEMRWLEGESHTPAGRPHGRADPRPDHSPALSAVTAGSVGTRIAPLYVAAALQWMNFWVGTDKPFMQSIGFTPALIGLAAAGYAMVAPSLEVPFGLLADRWSRVGVLRVGGAALAVSVILQGVSTEPVLNIIGKAVLAVFFAATSGTYESLLYDTLAESGRQATFAVRLGWFRLLALSGGALGALAGGVMATFDLRLNYALSAATAIAAIAALMLVREPAPSREATRPSTGQLRGTIAVIVRNARRPACGGRHRGVHGAVASPARVRAVLAARD